MGIDHARRAPRLWLVTLLLLGLVPIFGHAVPVEAAATRNVSPGGTDLGNCTAGACRTIAYALSQAVSGDTVSLAAGVFTEHDVVIDKSVTIAGIAAKSTVVDGSGADPVLRAINGSTVTISNMTIRNGTSVGRALQGGALTNSSGIMTVINVIVTGNSGSGIANGGVLNITNSVIAGNIGTGIWNYGGTLSVSSSTISNNSSDNSGDDGFGIRSDGGNGPGIVATIVNTTIAGNVTGAGFGSTAALTNVTIAHNTAKGLTMESSGADITVKNSFVADGCGGPVTSGDYNIDGGTSCNFGQAHDHNNATDPRLGPLVDNGGPTPTIALLPGSLAINAASNAACPATDQRGIARPQGGICDIGAYEFTDGFVVSVPSVQEGAGNAFSVTLTNADAAGNTVSGYTGTAHFTSTDGQAVLPADYLFTGGDAGVHTFTGIVLKMAGSQRITATDSVSPAITGSGVVRVLGGVAVTFGFVFSPSQPVANVNGAVAVSTTDMYGNVASGYRGTVQFTSNDGQATLPADYTFTSADAGAHTFLVTFKNPGSRTFTATQTTPSLSGTANITIVPQPAIVYVNLAWAGTAGGSDPDGAGPATHFGYDGFITIADALYFVAPGGTINIAAGTYAEHDLALTRDVTINGAGAANTIVDARQLGRGFMTYIGVAVGISGVTIRNGSASGLPPGGGGILNYGATLILKDSVLASNAAGIGGGLSNIGGTATITRSSVAGNTAGNAAGLYNESGTLTLMTSTVNGNTIPGGVQSGINSGSGLYTYGGTVTLANTTVSGNVSNLVIGNNPSSAISGSQGSLTLTNVTIANNTTYGLQGAGLYGLTIRGTIIADGCQGVVGVSGGYNLDSGVSCSFNSPHDLSNVNPQLGPLANNGGPTQTHALLANSPAINAGGTSANGCPATDQRGVTRPQRGACDIGAFEVLMPLEVIAPASSRVGDGISVTVTAKDALGNTQTGYTATVHLTSSDSQATLPADYPFGGGDHGAHTFSATLRTIGTQTITATDTVTGALPPTIADISPSVGLPAGGASVTITGANFQAGATVAFGGVAATNISVVNGTTITCLAPAHGAGDVSVTVTNPDTQAATLPNGYTYAARSPQPSPRAGGGMPPGTPVNPVPGGR